MSIDKINPREYTRQKFEEIYILDEVLLSDLSDKFKILPIKADITAQDIDKMLGYKFENYANVVVKSKTTNRKFVIVYTYERDELNRARFEKRPILAFHCPEDGSAKEYMPIDGMTEYVDSIDSDHNTSDALEDTLLLTNSLVEVVRVNTMKEDMKKLLDMCDGYTEIEKFKILLLYVVDMFGNMDDDGRDLCYKYCVKPISDFINKNMFSAYTVDMSLALDNMSLLFDRDSLEKQLTDDLDEKVSKIYEDFLDNISYDEVRKELESMKK